MYNYRKIKITVKIFYLVLLYCSLCNISIAQKKDKKSRKNNKSKINFEGDDLSDYRITLDFDIYRDSVANKKNKEVQQQIDEESFSITVELDTILEKIARINSKILKTTSGYRVIAYSGTNRSKANKADSLLKEILPDKIELIYEQPNYKVKIGYYLTQIEAYSVYSQIKKIYPLAIIVDDEIVINTEEDRN